MPASGCLPTSLPSPLSAPCLSACLVCRYIGFSQGSAQMFAALALHPRLNDQLACFIALSPALAVRGLARSPLVALVESVSDGGSVVTHLLARLACRPTYTSLLPPPLSRAGPVLLLHNLWHAAHAALRPRRPAHPLRQRVGILPGRLPHVPVRVALHGHRHRHQAAGVPPHLQLRQRQVGRALVPGVCTRRGGIAWAAWQTKCDDTSSSEP